MQGHFEAFEKEPSTMRIVLGQTRVFVFRVVSKGMEGLVWLQEHGGGCFQGDQTLATGDPVDCADF